MISRTVLEIDLNILHLFRVTCIQERRIMNPLLWNKFIFYLTKDGKQFAKDIKILQKFTFDVISSRMKSKSSPANVDNIKKLAFLDLLIEARTEDGESLKAADIQEEVDTFMFAGHDTNSAALTWGIYLLGRYQEVQDKVIEEIDAVFGDDKDRPVTMDDLRKLTYLEQAIKETLRKYPPGAMLIRELVDDLEIDGHVIPKSTQVIVYILIIHHNPAIWENPESFDPDRFSKENCDKRHPYAFIPFSAGPRNCIGQRFALQEQKVILAYFFRNFRVISHEEEPNVPISFGAVVHPRNILKISFIKR